MTVRLAVAEENIMMVINPCAVLQYEDKGQVLPEDPSVRRPLVVMSPPPPRQSFVPSTGGKRSWGH